MLIAMISLKNRSHTQLQMHNVNNCGRITHKGIFAQSSGIVILVLAKFPIAIANPSIAAML